MMIAFIHFTVYTTFVLFSELRYSKITNEFHATRVTRPFSFLNHHFFLVLTVIACYNFEIFPFKFWISFIFFLYFTSKTFKMINYNIQMKAFFLYIQYLKSYDAQKKVEFIEWITNTGAEAVKSCQILACIQYISISAYPKGTQTKEAFYTNPNTE